MSTTENNNTFSEETYISNTSIHNMGAITTYIQQETISNDEDKARATTTATTTTTTRNGGSPTTKQTTTTHDGRLRLTTRW